MMGKHTKADWRDRRIAAPGPYLCLCLDEKTFHAALDDCGIKDRPLFIANIQSNASMHSATHADGSLVCIVTLASWSEHSPIEVAGLLVHEAVHVWQRYCEHIGERVPGNEQEAYGIQAIAQELMQSFSEKSR